MPELDWRTDGRLPWKRTAPHAAVFVFVERWVLSGQSVLEPVSVATEEGRSSNLGTHLQAFVPGGKCIYGAHLPRAGVGRAVHHHHATARVEHYNQHAESGWRVLSCQSAHLSQATSRLPVNLRRARDSSCLLVSRIRLAGSGPACTASVSSSSHTERLLQKHPSKSVGNNLHITVNGRLCVH